MKKYGLQLRVQPTQQKKLPARPPLPPPLGFRDDDEDNVEREISRQASKNKSLKDIEEQHKKALEEDPSVFDYDGVYDEMKGKMALPREQERQERKPKYIQTLIEKAKTREREHEIVYERKLAKERSEEDHLYADKDKFVTAAYKRKLAEQAKWMEEERLRQLREEKEDVTKKKDMSDFYFNLSKNIAFGSREAESRKLVEQEKEASVNTVQAIPRSRSVPQESPEARNELQGETFSHREDRSISSDVKNAPSEASGKVPPAEPSTPPQPPPSADHPPKHDHHKRGQDAVAAAKERFLARKKAKEQ